MSSSGIQLQNLIIFLVSALLMILSLLWILWFHRIFASILSRILNFYFRRKYGNSAYFHVKSIYLAPLGGKILFKQLQYTTSDYSVYAIDGIIVISWWNLLRNLDSRLSVRMHGVECVIFDNTPLYESVVKGGTKNKEQRGTKNKKKRAKPQANGAGDATKTPNAAALTSQQQKKPSRFWVLSWIFGIKSKKRPIAPNNTNGTPLHIENDDFISDAKLDKKRARKGDDEQIHMDMGLEDLDVSSEETHESAEDARRRAWIKSTAKKNRSTGPQSSASDPTPIPPTPAQSPPKSTGSSFFTFLGMMRWVRNIKFVVKKCNLIIGNYKTPSYAQISCKSASGKFFVDEVSGLNPESNLHVKMEEAKVQFINNPQVNTNHKPHHLKFMDRDNMGMQDVINRYRELFNEEPIPGQPSLDPRIGEAPKRRDKYGKPLSDAQNEHYPYGHTYPNPIDLSEIDQSVAFECSLVTIHYSQHVQPIYTPGVYYEPPQQQLSLEFEKFTNNTIVYGPWGDHQRTLLQEFFFPKTYKDLDPVTLEEGVKVGTEFFDISIVFKQKSMWRLPFIRTPEREEEKQRGKGKQEYFDVHFDAGSSVHWRNPNLRRDTGSSIDVKINFKNVRGISSNTGAVLGEAELFEGHWVMSYSPEWNGPKHFCWDWNFSRGHMFYLWEHTSFIQDFIRDWSNWENPQEATLREFIPSNYIYNFNFFDFHMYMCLNAHNIIDSHNNFHKNSYADIRTPHLQFQFSLNSEKFNPEFSDFVFDINLFSSETNPEEMPYMQMKLADDHPLKPHLEGEDTTFLTGKKGFLHGVYTYYNKIRKDALDCFKLDIDFYDVLGNLNGAYVRLFITWFINHFSYNSKHLTSKEFEMNGYKNDKSRQIWLLQITDEDGFRYARNNLEYYIVLHIHKGQGTLPLNLHSTHEQMGTIFAEEVALEARYMPQYLDLTWTLSPFTAEFPVQTKKESGSRTRRKFIGCTGMSGWGKMPTGPPPDHNFYYMDMDFQFGEITGEIMPAQCRDILAFLTNWVSQFTSAFPPSPYDNIEPVYENREFVPAEVSKHRPIFIKVAIEQIHMLLLTEKGHINIELAKGFSLDYSSLNDGQTNSRIQLDISHIDVEFLTANSLKKGLLEEVVNCKSVGKFSSGIVLRKHFRKPSVLQDFNLQQDFLNKNQAPNLFETHYSKFDAPTEQTYEENGDQRNGADKHADGDSAVQEEITNVSELDSLVSANEDHFRDPGDDGNDESFISFDSNSDSEFEEEDDRSFTQQRKPYVETVTGKKVTMKDDVIKRIEEQLHELLKQATNAVPETDEDIIFFKDEKTKHFAVSAYEEFLRTLEMSRESDEVVSPLRFSSQNISGVPHISSSSDSIGTYAYWPRTDLRDISTRKVHDYHHIHTSQAPLSDAAAEHHTIQNRETLESMEVGEQCSFNHFSLQFVRAIDILLTPHAVEMIGSIICAIMSPVGQNINATCDDIEKSSQAHLKPKPVNDKKDQPPDFPLSKITLSCSLSAIKVHIVQAIRPPNIINSSLLKDLNVYSTKMVANNFFCAVSFSWKKELENDKLKSELFSVEGSFTLESLRLATQCFTKTKEAYRGISDFELNDEMLKSIIAAHPVVLSGNAENISIKTIHRLSKDESQGRVSCTSGKPIELFTTQEIPLILFSMYEVWEHSIHKQVNKVRATRTARQKARITLLAGIAKLKGEDLFDAPTQINDQGDFVINHVQNIPAVEAILDVRQKIRELTAQEKEILQQWIDSVSTDSTSVKKLKQNVSFTHWSLIEDSTFAPHLQEQIKSSGSSLFDRKLRLDLFVSVQQLSFSLHAHAANSGSVKKSTGSIHHVDLRGQLEVKTDKVHKLSTNQFLHTATNAQSVKQRDISTIMNLNVDSIDVDIHPRAYEVVTVVTGILVGLKSHANQQRKGGKTKISRDPFQWLNKKTSGSNVQKPAPERSSSSGSLRPTDSIAMLDAAMETDPDELPPVTKKPSRRSILPLLDSDKQVETHFHGFFNLLVGKVEGRAWMARGINFAQLSFDKISLCVNKPRMDKASTRHLDKNSKLIQCASGSVQNVHFEYNYAPLPKESTVVPDFISLFDTTVSDIGVNQFFFTTGNKNGEIVEHLQFLPEVGALSINIPYSDTWSAASLQFKLFVLDWWHMVKQKPDVKLPAQYEYPLSEATSEGASQTMSPKAASTTASLKMPAINVIVDIHSIQLLFMLLPTLQMRYSMSRVMAFFNRQDASYSSFRLHVFSNSLAFKTDADDVFPEQFNAQWNSQHTFGTGASETKNFKKLFLLPEVLVYGDLSTHDSRPHLKASVIVEYVENIITGDIINYIMSVQSGIVKEVNNILTILQKRINKDEITERIRSELPRAQASVKNLNAYFDINVFLEGLHFTAFSPATAMILDSGKIDLGVSRGAEGIKWNVDLKNSTVELVDLANFKWSDLKEFQGKYSNSKQCYKWASFCTNIHVENRNIPLSERPRSPEEGSDAPLDGSVVTSTQKLFVTIADTNVYIRPGCPQITILMFRDYQESVRNLISEFKESRKHLNTEILKQLIETGEEYYTYYSEKIVKSVTSDPTMLIYSGLVRVTNTTLTIPFGDNPYFGFLYNANPSFSPTAVVHVILTSVDLTTRTLTDPTGHKKARGIVVVNNVYAYADDCSKSDIKNQTYVPSMTKFMESSHKCNLPDAFVGVDFNMDASVLRAKVTATVSGPEVSVNPEILNYILDMSHDWFSGREQLRSSDDLLHRVIRKQIQTPKILTESEATVPFLKQKVHVTCRLKVKSGECKFHHTLDVPVQTSEKPMWASISEKQDNDPSIVAVATLPSFLIDVVHIAPSLVSFSTGGTSTHLQINVNWKGVRLDPKSMLFLNEGWFTYQAYSKRQKQLRQQRGGKLADLNQYKNEHCAKPERWMKYVNSAIMIQRLFRGYLTRRIVRDMKGKGTRFFVGSTSTKAAATAEEKAAPPKTSLAANSISILCRVQPFSVHMTSSPVSDVVTSFEFSKPFDILFTRMHRHLHRRNEKGDALFNTVFLNSPEILVRMYNSLNPDEFLRLMISGVVANVGAGYGPLLRPDREATISGTISIDKIKVQFNLPQISQALLMYSLWMEKSAEAKQALANQISKVQASTRVRRNQAKEGELTLESTISKYGQVLIKKIEISSDLDYMIGKQLMEVHSVSLFIRDRGRFLNSQYREPLHIGGYITRGVVRLTGRLSGAIHASGLMVGMDHEFPVGDANNPVYRGKTNLKVRILPLDLSIDYNMDKIITLYSESFIGQFQDVFDSPDGLKSHIQSKFSLETLILRLSSVAAPAFIKVFFSLLDTLKNRRNNALKVLQRSTFYYHRDSLIARDEIEKDIRTIKQLKVKSPIEQFKEFNILGNVTVFGSNINIFLHDRFKLDDKNQLSPMDGRLRGDYTSFGVEEFQVKYVRNAEEKAGHSPQNPNFTILRKMQLFLLKADIDRNTVSSQRISLIRVPGGSMIMKSKQSNLNDVIQYEFTSRFPDSITVSTNLAEYTFFRKLLGFYQESVKKELTTKGADTEQNDFTFSSPEEASVPPSPKSEKSSLSTLLNQEFNGVINFNPKLDVLGDMTPSVETVLGWLGIKDRSFVAKLTHTAVSNSLEAFLIGCKRISDGVEKVTSESK